MVLSACGGNSGGSDTTTQKDTPGTLPDESGNADLGTTDPGKPAGNPHPYWANADWDTAWPEQGETAVYRAVLFGGEEKDVSAYMDHTPVEWKGGTWIRAIIGTPEPGKDGFIVYFDKSEPWNPKAKGVEVYSANVADGPSMVEWFDEPLEINMDGSEGSKNTISKEINGDYGGFEDSMGANYAFTIVSYEASVDVPYGTVDGCMHIQLDLSGELIGPGSIVVDAYLHPDQFFIKMTDTPGFALIELKEGWE